MSEIKLKVRAKINLSLGIKGVTENGYHDLDMLLTSVEDIFDIVNVYDSVDIVVTMDGKVQGEKNTAYKALKLIQDNYNITMSADIEKGIPFSAGLGGSSCDAAGVFCAFSKLHAVKIDDLIPLADKVGSDVAFMMRGGSAISRGQGSTLTYVDLPKLDVVVMKAKGGSDTRAVFQNYDNLAIKNNVDNRKLVDKIKQGKEYSNLMENQLYLPASGLNSEIKLIFDALKKVTDYVIMTGSGSSIVAIFHNEKEKQKIIEIAKKTEYYKVTRTSMFGVEQV